jgi:hypothetical protein
MNFNFIRQNLRASLARFISPPVANLPAAGSLPQIQLVSPPVPSAIGGPGQLVKGNPSDLSATIERIGSMSVRDLMTAQAAHRAKFPRTAGRPAAVRAGTPAPRAATPPPALDDDGVAQPIPTAEDPIGVVITQLEQCLRSLKECHPDVSADDADASEAEAKACLRAGNKAAALRHFDAAISKWGANIVAKKARASLLAQPSSRQRATALIRQGFGSQSGVMALNAALGRGPQGHSSSTALPPVIPPSQPAAVATTTSTAPDVAKIRLIKSELAQLEIEQRKEFSNARNDKHAALSRQLKAELRKFHV